MFSPLYFMIGIGIGGVILLFKDFGTWKDKLRLFLLCSPGLFIGSYLGNYLGSLIKSFFNL